jgi:sigma-E factor negative regulatory protein RseA
MEKIETREMISALADGQLRGDAFSRGVELAVEDPSARDAWQTYHLIGDVLRSAELAASSRPDAFVSRLRARLGEEPQPSVAGIEVSVPAPLQAAPAANDGSFRWKVAAGVASLAAVAAVGWTVVGVGKPAEPAQIAATPDGTVLAGSQQGPMIRDARLDELLAAHRQLGGASALQTPAGFLRNATFDGAGR